MVSSRLRLLLIVLLIGPLGSTSWATEEAWQILFDGRTLDGWIAASEVDWAVRDGAIVASEGSVGLLHTRDTYGDFELRLEFRAEPETNSGVFFRSLPRPTDPTVDCFELNIAPPSHPYPTGSLVGRVRAEADAPGPGWHRLELRAVGDRVEVRIGGRSFLEYDAAERPSVGVIGLQFNQGQIAFRDIRIRRLD